MSERDRIHIPVRVQDDELAPETLPALPQGELSVFTPRQADRLGVFRHMLVTVFDAEKEEKEKRAPTRFGTSSEVYFHLDSRYRNIWNHQAEHLYREELALDPKTKQAAEDIRDQLKLEYEGKTMSKEEVRKLFER